MNVFSDFFNTWDRLDEIYVKDFDEGSDTQFYHFFEDLADLTNSLFTRRIYSNKNEKASQLDVFAPKGSSYVCMTVGKEGKQRTAKNFGTRPFGIAFNNLAELCSNRKYMFNPSEDGFYSQFLAKTQYDLVRNGREKGTATKNSVIKDIAEFRDFELLAIGKLGGDYTGYYFISGGQGRNLSNHWSSKLFKDEKLYNTLRKWFMWNMSDRWKASDIPEPKRYSNKMAVQQNIFYHFVNDTIGGPRAGHPEDLYKDHVINTTGNLNSQYIPWVDELGGETHDSAMDFRFKVKQVEFDEIIGVGPFMVKDEVGNILLHMDMCKPGNKGGYTPPKLFSTQALTDVTDTDGSARGYSDTADTYVSGRGRKIKTLKGKESRPEHLLMDKYTATALASLYNESEYRVYVPQKKDFVFTPKDISSIVLPAEISTAGKVKIDLNKLVHILAESPQEIPESKVDFIQYLLSNRIVHSGNISEHTFKNLVLLIQLLQDNYSDVNVEVINGMNVTSLALNTKYATTGEDDNKLRLNRAGNYRGSGKLRLLTNFDVMQQIEDAEEVPWKEVTSVIAYLQNLGAKARLGAETILIGADANDRKYVLFVDNAHKAQGFLELPGGGLHTAPVKKDDFKTIAQQRLYFKGGLDASKIRELTDTNHGLLLYENGVAEKGKSQSTRTVTWPWSYYQLFTAFYTETLNEEDTDYSFDNRDLDIIKAKGEDGYDCYLKWIPVDSLDYNRSLLTRYSNIFNIIRSTAQRY
jgi:hypothetical protein